MQKENLSQLTKNNRLYEQLLRVFGQSTLGGNPNGSYTKEESWTCKHCKAEKCFASRKQCYKCREARDPKVPSPPGLGSVTAPAKPSAKEVTPMEEEVPEEEVSLEDQIAEVEENLKILKGKTSPWALNQKLSLETHLKGLKDQQRLARPIPVRLQAATARVTKTAQEVKETEAEIAETEKVLAELAQKKAERLEKHQAALVELEAVKQAAGAEPVDTAEKGLAAGICAALSARSITGVEAQTFLEEVAKFYEQLKQGGGFSQVQGPGAVNPGQPGVLAGSAGKAVFVAGGAFPSVAVGSSPFQVLQPAASAASQQEERQAWEQGRAEELAKLKIKLEAHRLRHGTLVTQLATAQEAAKAELEKGGGGEAAAKVSQLMAEGSQVLTELESMEKYRSELESEAFGKASVRTARGSPY